MSSLLASPLSARGVEGPPLLGGPAGAARPSKRKKCTRGVSGGGGSSSSGGRRRRSTPPRRWPLGAGALEFPRRRPMSAPFSPLCTLSSILVVDARPLPFQAGARVIFTTRRERARGRLGPPRLPLLLLLLPSVSSPHTRYARRAHIRLKLPRVRFFFVVPRARARLFSGIHSLLVVSSRNAWNSSFSSVVRRQTLNDGGTGGRRRRAIGGGRPKNV